MCRICGQQTHASACPNASDGRAEKVCFNCGRQLFHGDTAYGLLDLVFCEDCVSDSVFEVSA